MTIKINVSLKSRKFVIIADRCNGLNGQEESENDLEKALETGWEIIIIEHQKLGEGTARWIYAGDYILSTCFVSGLGSLISSLLCSQKPYIYTPMATICILCSTFHQFFWEKDTILKYKVDKNPKLTIEEVNAPVSIPSPVVLVKRRKSLKHKIVLRTAISLIAFAFSAWRLYNLVTIVSH